MVVFLDLEKVNNMFDVKTQVEMTASILWNRYHD